MRKVAVVSLVVLVVLATLLSAFPVAAQEGDPVPLSIAPCTEDEWAILDQAGADIAAGVDGLGEIPAEITDAVLGEVVVGANQLAFQYSSVVYMTMPNCGESQLISFRYGTSIEHLMMAAAFSNIAGWATATGQTEVADYFLAAASWQLDTLQIEADSIANVTSADIEAWMGVGLPACSDEEKAAFVETLTAYYEANVEPQPQTSESLVGMDAATLLGAVVAANDLNVTYWEEVYPSLPACIEAYNTGFLAGTLLDETNMTVTLFANAALENELGHAATAEALIEGANARIEYRQPVLASFHSALGVE